MAYVTGPDTVTVRPGDLEYADVSWDVVESSLALRRFLTLRRRA